MSYDIYGDSLIQDATMDSTNVVEPIANNPNNPACRYGSDCYRKNPKHLKEFYHPDRIQGKL
jgi:hypothetical protein